MPPERQAAVLESILQTLLAEESVLRELVRLAEQEQDALLRADYEAIHDTSGAMLARSGRVEELERERLALLQALEAPDATVSEVTTIAAEAGVAGFAQAKAQLISTMGRLRNIQERNARLLLAAMKLNERWITMFGAMSSPTYGSDGSQERAAGRQLMSRSA